MHSGVIDSPVITKSIFSANTTGNPCTTESLTPLWHAQRSHWHRCADMQVLKNVSGVIDSAVQIWHRCDFWRLLCEALATFKGNINQKTYIGQLSCTIPITFTHKKWGLTRDHFLAQRSHWLRCDKNRRLLSRFSRRILIHMKKALNRVYGA
jgi:hypothetical protein